MSPVALVLVAHGTSDRHGQETVRLLRARLQRGLPGVQVLDAYVDVQSPRLDEVVDQLVRQRIRTILVPVLLSTGYHMEVDVAGAASRSPLVTAGPPLGPDPLLAEVLRDRLLESGATPGDRVVLAAAGSSRPQAADAVRTVADQLAALWSGRVIAGFAAAATPSVAEALEDATADGGRVRIASYLMGRGFFHDRLQRYAVPVTEPLGADPRIVTLVRRRFDDALRATTRQVTRAAG